MDPETATAVPRSPVSATIRARDLTVIQDKPAAYGGQNDGMMASELLMASLLGCQLSTFAKVAAKRRSDATVTEIEAATHFDDAGDIDRIDLTWDIQGADDKAAATLVRLTEKVCTISRALKAPVASTIRTSAAK